MSRKNGGIIGPANTPVGGLMTGSASGVWRTNDLLNFVANNQWPQTPQNIENSCRFNDGSTENLSRTLSSTGNQKKFTISLWTKPSTFQQQMFLSTASNKQYGFETDQRVFFYENLGGGTERPYIRWAAQCRDVSAWYHIVLGVDTTQSTDTDRMKLYINGTLITTYASTPTHPSLNQDLNYNNNSLHVIGKYSGTTGGDYDGYMAEYVFVDGQQLDATSFGETNTATGIWTPKKIGSFGTVGDNTFYLNFKDSSNLGNDASGKNNDFTVTNLTSIDQSTDTCVENYCVMNPLNLPTSNPPTFSDGNLKTVTSTSGSGRFGGSSTFGVSKGKWYIEAKATIGASYSRNSIGVSYDPAEMARNNSDNVLTHTTYAWGWDSSDGSVYHDSSVVASYASYTTGDICQIFLDLDNHKLYFGKNGTLQSSTGISLDTGETYFIAQADRTGTSDTSTFEFNYGSPIYSISSGNSDPNGHGNFEYSTTITGDGASKNFYALNTSNLNTYG